MDRSGLAVVIPALNEAGSIAAVVEGLPTGVLAVVVDDGSTDATAREAHSAGAEVISQPRTCGYDRALEAGFARAAELGASFVVTMDADGQHDPALLDNFLHLLQAGADVVVGIRDRRQRIAEHCFAWLARYRWGIHDPLCGFKGYRIELYHELGHFDANGSIGTELMLFAVRRHKHVVQLPVPTRPRVGTPRFGASFRSNIRIIRAAWLAISTSGRAA